MDALQFKPLYQKRVWGGRRFEAVLHRQLPEGDPIGESWEIVDRPEANSVVQAGMSGSPTLRALIERDSASVMGPAWDAQRPFPILVKWLDCDQRLSLQVHPPADIAPELGGEPKTENWFVVEAAEEAAVLAGLKPGIDREQLAQAIEDQSVEELVWRLPTRAGASLFVPSGRLHAIDAGNLILEIQQNSDTTYRVYDWGRVGLDGKPRALHIEQSLASIAYEDTEPELLHAGEGTTRLVESEVFTLTCHRLQHNDTLSFAAEQQPRILSIVQGSLMRRPTQPYHHGQVRDFHKGDNLLLPYAGEFTLTAEEETLVLVTEAFA